MKTVSVREARANFSELLGSVYYTNNPVIVEKKGKPFAVVMSPGDYQNYQTYKKAAKKRFFEIVDEIQQANKDKSFEEVYEDVTKAVEEVRQERHAKGR